MTLQHAFKVNSLIAVATLALAACGGGGGSAGGDEPPDDPLPPQPVAADFGKTISDLLAPEGTVTLPDGKTYDADSAPIEMSDYLWDIDNSDVDESPLDDVFSG